jgi:AraC-like DNA-binding protein
MPTSCSHYFIETIRAARRVDVDADLMLQNVGLTHEQISDPNWRGDVELLARLVQLLWFATNDEFMGFISKPARIGTFAMMTQCIINKPSLESAFRLGLRFYDLATDGMTMSLDQHGAETRFVVRFEKPELDPAHYFLEFWMVIWYRLLGWLGGTLPPLTRATFAYPKPRYFEELKHMFPSPHEFDADENALYFETRALRQPLIRSHDELKQFLAVAPIGFMMIPSDENSLARRIRTALLSGRKLPLNFPPLEEMARQFETTEQTLRRKLKEEATSYRAIKEAIRRDIAVQKLMENRTSIGELSVILGYSEPRAFTRAFQQWTGFSPVQYRTRLKQQFGA